MSETIQVGKYKLNPEEYKIGAKVSVMTEDQSKWDYTSEEFSRMRVLPPKSTGVIIALEDDQFRVRHTNGEEGLYDPPSLWVKGYPEPLFPTPEDEKVVDLGDLPLNQLAEVFPEQASLSIGHMGSERWTAILRPMPKEQPQILLPGYVPPSQTPVMAAGPSLGAALTGAFALLAPEAVRCPQCGEFCLEKLSDVAGSDHFIECLTCGKQYAGAH